MTSAAKNTLLSFVVGLLATITVLANNPDAVLGVWKNGEGTGMVQVYKKGDKYFGRIVWLKVANDAAGKPRTDLNNPDEKLRTRTLKGMENLRDFAFKGDNKWEGGRIYDPKNGND